MTFSRPWHPIVPIACALMIASCAGSRPTLPVAPPRLTLPEAATRRCELPTLAERLTEADLDLAYVARGRALVACDGARRLAIDTLLAERLLQDRWRLEAARRD